MSEVLYGEIWGPSQRFTSTVTVSGLATPSATPIVQFQPASNSPKPTLSYTTYISIPSSLAMIIAAFSPMIITVLLVFALTFDGQMLPSVQHCESNQMTLERK